MVVAGLLLVSELAITKAWGGDAFIHYLLAQTANLNGVN